jgi:phosphoribosylamine--glycine ligase
LNEIDVAWDQRAALGVVMAAGGYPLSYRKGDVIHGLPKEEGPGPKIFHAGTTMKDGQVVTSGGRVLCVTALGGTVREAQRNAYDLVETIHWDNVYYRTDIGYRAIFRESATG